MTGIDIILYLIALGVCILIGVAAAFERVVLYDFAIVMGLWYGVLYFIQSTGILFPILYAIVYLIVTIGTLLTWGGK